MTSREKILKEIQRLATLNEGRAPGWELFKSETGLNEHSWRGRYWPKWSDAVVEAGFPENEFNRPYTNEEFFVAFAEVARKLGHIPTEAEYKLACRQNPNLPSTTAYRRLGTKAQFIEKLAVFSQTRNGFDDITQLCADYRPKAIKDNAENTQGKNGLDGFVYLIKSGRSYKIGRSNAAGRREREIALQLPEAVKTMHVIRTDDPVGIETYWHNRFSEKRKNGEWFDLNTTDVSAFRRRKFM